MSALSKIATPITLIFSLAAVVACGASPSSDSTADAPAASPGGAERPALLRQPVCLSATCSAMCSTELGVPGGHCVANLCTCDAATCGQLGQRPCAGNACVKGHYDAATEACDNCGTQGATCCDRNHPGATTSCYGGLYCQGGISCWTCGAEGQPACQPEDSSQPAFCNAGLSPAGPPNDLTCFSQSECGYAGHPPCLSHPTSLWGTTLNPNNPGCREYNLVFVDGLCQWPTDCGNAGQGCCNAGSYFQGPDFSTDLCNEGGLSCEYDGFPGFGSWRCYAPSSGGSGSSSGSGPVTCDQEPCGLPTCDPSFCCQSTNCCAGTWGPECDPSFGDPGDGEDLRIGRGSAVNPARRAE